MRIGINVSWMTPGQAGGMEGYVRNLIAQLGAIDRNNEYVLVTAPNNHRTFSLPSGRWTKVAYTGPESSPTVYRGVLGHAASDRRRLGWLRRLYRQRRALRARSWSGGLSDLIRREGIQLWFCPIIYALPLDAPVPIVTTIPDLQHEVYPEFFTNDELALRAMGYPYSCAVATAVIGISQRVADDIVRLYGVPAGRVFATSLALDTSYEQSPPAADRLLDRVRLKFRLEGDFVFYPANGWKHKNHEILVEALHIVRQRVPSLKLLLTGCEFDVLDRLRPLVRKYRLQDAVRHLGYVSRDDLAGLYTACKLLVFPSLFEGFGLPLLEAMHFGAPIACSNVGSLPEVGGNAVLYFDPQNADEVAGAIVRIVEDDHLRARLMTAGREQVRRFSYARTARLTLAIFEKIAAGELRPPGLPPFRPPIAHNWLNAGHSRWYFRAGPTFTLHLDLVQPTLLDTLKDQRVEVRLDGQPVAVAAMEPQHVYRLSHVFQNGDLPSLHALDIAASARTRVGDQLLSAQVAGLRVVDATGKELRLSQ